MQSFGTGEFGVGVVGSVAGLFGLERFLITAYSSIKAEASRYITSGRSNLSNVLTLKFLIIYSTKNIISIEK